MRRALAQRMVLAVLVAGVAVLAAFAAPAGALVRPVSSAYLMHTAETIVLARAVGAQSYRSADSVPGALGGTIVTDVRLRVNKVLKGAAAATVTLTIPGGRVGGMGLTCPDAPSFQRGLTYLIYLDAGDQIVAWRRGQPLVIGGRVPELGKTLKQIERHVALSTGRRATVYSRPAASATSDGVAVRVASGTAKSGADTSGSSAYLVLPKAAAGGGSSALRVGTPAITGISPVSAPAGTGDVITIAGSGFGAARGAGEVWFFYQKPDPNTEPIFIDAPVVSWTDSAIACVVPTDIIDNYAASAGSGPVYVRLDDGTLSNGYPFTVSFSYGGKQWPRNKCRFRVNAPAGRDDWELAVRQAADTWTALSAGGFRFIDGGTANDSGTPAEDGYNDIVWGSIEDPDVIAAAWTYDIGHAILETDIVFNSAYTWGTAGGSTEMDVQTIAVHELGHWLNLRDLYGPQDLNGPGDLGDTAKIMYGFCDYGIVKRNPDPADQAGASWIYSASHRDTQRPTSTAAKPETVRRSRVVDLSMLVTDPEYSCGAAAVRVIIADRSGRTVARVLGWGVPTNEWTYIPFRCKLPRGVYRWRVQATDMTGRRQIKVGSNRLIVR